MAESADTRIQLRRGTASEWSTSNPTLGIGEPAYDTTNSILKVGDGTRAWNDLASKTRSDTAPIVANYSGSNTAVVSGVFNIVILNQDTFNSQTSKDPNTIYFVT
jgi:hypothetical protein